METCHYSNETISVLVEDDLTIAAQYTARADSVREFLQQGYTQEACTDDPSTIPLASGSGNLDLAVATINLGWHLRENPNQTAPEEDLASCMQDYWIAKTNDDYSSEVIVDLRGKLAKSIEEVSEVEETSQATIADLSAQLHTSQMVSYGSVGLLAATLLALGVVKTKNHLRNSNRNNGE